MVSPQTYWRDEHAGATMTTPKPSAHGDMRPSAHSSWNHFAKLPAHFRKYLSGQTVVCVSDTPGLSTALQLVDRRVNISMLEEPNQRTPRKQTFATATPAASTRNCWRRHSSRVFRPEEARVTRIGRRFSGKEEISNYDLSPTSAGSAALLAGARCPDFPAL
jgi:hypothetical protein